MLNLFLTLALVVLIIVPLTFIWHEVYRDGVVGRLGLGAISLFAIVCLARFHDGKLQMPVEVACLVIAFAVFLVWHLLRFHSRVVKQRRDPKAHAFHQGA